ncbi:MAG: T9SS type A sorting domain-containing protein, partial [Synechococcus sp.]|nr:T9SS type A sorting domain-containing protein [Synechococcus sp.]
YWKIYSGPYTTSPEHSWIVRDYARETYGRHVYVGIGAYVDGTIQQLPAMIDTSRVSGLKGQVYFRWGSIYAFNVQTGTVGPQITYRKPAIVPPMSWRSQTAPGQPVIASHSRSGQDVALDWEPVSFNDNGDTLVRYAIYRVIGNTAPDPEEVITDVQNLVTVTGGTSLTNRLPATDQNVYYVVTTLSRNNVESLPSQPYLVSTSTSVEPEPDVPYVTGLEVNYPNPFNPTTVIGFQLSVFGQARLSVYDLLGREIAVLADGVYPAGRHEAVFDAGNLGLASGVYVTVLRVGDRQYTRRITLLK